jgi:hypothetical protein
MTWMRPASIAFMRGPEPILRHASDAIKAERSSPYS